MRLPLGYLAENDKKNVGVFEEHFSNVLNSNKKNDKNIINKIILRKFMTELDKVPTWEEFMNAVAQLPNNKAPGINNVLPNSLKTKSENNFLHYFNFILKFWEDRLDYVE